MDAEGRHDGVPCPRCGSVGTITYYYVEGFEELECPDCGYASDADELDALTRYASDLVEGAGAYAAHRHLAPSGRPEQDGPEPDSPAIPRRSLKA